MWDIDELDLDAYLDRIKHPRPQPSAESLKSLHRAHVLAIPFENIDVILGTHPGIALAAIHRLPADRW
jgi:N-hydroxyarylamine O-acetyltransferase